MYDDALKFTPQIALVNVFKLVLMQPSIGILNSPSSRIIKYLTPFQCQILRCINLGLVNLHLSYFWTWWIFIQYYFEYIEQMCVLLFYLFQSEVWPRKHKVAWWIFTQFYFSNGESLPICFGKKVNWWWILTQWVWWKGEHYRWRLMRVGYCMHQRASWTYPPQVFTSVHLFNKIIRSRFTISSPLFRNNWVKIHHRKNKVRWRFTKLIYLF